MEKSNFIIENLSDAHELERLYRKDAEKFKKMFIEAYAQYTDSESLKVWNERLNFEEDNKLKLVVIERDFLPMMVIALLSGICSRIIFYFVELQMISSINLIFGILPFIALYFIYQNKPSNIQLFIILGILMISIISINILPLTLKDSVILAYLHLPVLLWLWVGLAYVGNSYKLGKARLAFLKFNGEFIILYAIMAIGGIVLTAITMQLFFMIDIDISEFYFSNIVLIGVASLSVLASYLVSKNLKLAQNIAPYIACIFGPLVLITLVVYLISVILVGKNPFLDRDFLLLFNAILVVVLAISIFSITESNVNKQKTLSDMVNFALIIIALVIDSIAVSAIAFRLSSFGITPNRVAVLGMNGVIWVNLVWIFFEYLRFIRNKTTIESVQNAVTKYLPVYGIWSIIVIMLFPVIF